MAVGRRKCALIIADLTVFVADLMGTSGAVKRLVALLRNCVTVEIAGVFRKSRRQMSLKITRFLLRELDRSSELRPPNHKRIG